MRLITADDIDNMALGAAVLGTGGGGNPYLGRLMAQAALREYGPVQLLDPDEIADDAYVGSTGMMGAPTVGVEKLPNGDDLIAAIKGAESFLGREFDALMPGEIGGINSIVPFAVAARLGLPLVDADMIGRAFPELQMSIPGIYKPESTPISIADEKGNAAVIHAISNLWTERLARTICVEMGATAVVAGSGMSGVEIRELTVLRSITKIEGIGWAIRSARAGHLDPVEAVRAITDGALIWKGKIGDIRRHTTGGFARGEAIIEGLDEFSGRTLRVSFQNEFLVAQTDDSVLATTPDLITMLDIETGEAVTTEELRYGFRVAVIGIPCDPRFRTEIGLSVVGPRYFGYDIEYISIENRVKQTVLS
jgi:hypothetical protein